MKRTNPIYWSILLLFLAACGTDSAPELGGGTAQVRIASSLDAPTTDLSLQGVPIDPETGQSGVTRAVLEVFGNQSGEQLFFKGGQIVSEAQGEPITFTPQEGSVALALPPGGYSFVITGLDEREPANELAFGAYDSLEVGGEDEQIDIILDSLVGSVAFRAPETVEPNAIFDVFLEVSPPGRPDLRVPESNYTVLYDVDAPSILLSESQLGMRIAAACSDVTFRATALTSAPRQPGGSGQVPTEASVPVSGDVCGGDSEEEVNVDLVAPFISITDPSEGAEGRG